MGPICSNYRQTNHVAPHWNDQRLFKHWVRLDWIYCPAELQYGEPIRSLQTDPGLGLRAYYYSFSSTAFRALILLKEKGSFSDWAKQISLNIFYEFFFWFVFSTLRNWIPNLSLIGLLLKLWEANHSTSQCLDLGMKIISFCKIEALYPHELCQEGAAGRIFRSGRMAL